MVVFMKLIGFRKSDFLSKEGTSITGYTVYLSLPITGDGAGQACDRIYITDAKLAKCGYTPHVGDEVNVTYNKFGKVAAILPVGE